MIYWIGFLLLGNVFFMLLNLYFFLKKKEGSFLLVLPAFLHALGLIFAVFLLAALIN